MSEIAENNRVYDQWVNEQVQILLKSLSDSKTIEYYSRDMRVDDADRLIKDLKETYEKAKLDLDPQTYCRFRGSGR